MKVGKNQPLWLQAYVPVAWQAENKKIRFFAPELFSTESTINLTVFSLLKVLPLFE